MAFSATWRRNAIAQEVITLAINNPYVKYKEQSVNTATPEELTLMLYNGCIKFINIAGMAIEEKDISKAHENILKAQNIISELDMTLNMDIELSEGMHQLYVFIKDRLIDANISKDQKAIADAREIVTGMRDTWKEAMALARKGK